MTPSVRLGSSRSRKIGIACLALIGGTVLITWLAQRIDQARETDGADPKTAVTSIATQNGNLSQSPIRFCDVSEVVGCAMQHGPGRRGRLLHEDTGSGVAWADYDADGDWDLYVVNFRAAKAVGDDANCINHLFRNDEGHFVNVADAAGVADPEGFGMGATFADYDQDGDVDLYVTNYGPNRLFRNRGDGTFEEVANSAGVADPSWSTGAAWGDFDRDGHLDLYVCNYVDYDADEMELTVASSTAFGRHSVPFTLNPNSFDPMPNRLYRNRGDGTFEEVAERLGVSDPGGRSFAATLCDLDGDGWLDIYVTNDVSENKLFRNTLGDADADSGVVAREDLPYTMQLSRSVARNQRGGPLTFVDISALTGTADPRGSMGLSVGELGDLGGKLDTLPDLFVTHWLAQENALYQSEMISGEFLEYRDKTRQYALGEISIDKVGWGCGLADFDLDGRADLIVANGSTLEQPEDVSKLIPQQLLLFWNDGTRFQNVSSLSGEVFADPYNARGLAMADFDDDGDPDVAVLANRGRLMLLQNETANWNRSLKVRLHGPPSVCFGAKVEIVSEQRQQVQWWGADVSFLSMHAGELIFGLGSADQAESVVVTWADGRTSRRDDVAAGTIDLEYSATVNPNE